jgi:ATP-dependent Clp protease ATP-binding subunit ClpB
LLLIEATGEKKEATEMNRLHKSLDPTRTGRDAESLDQSLRHLIVGQDEAIDQIVSIYQMYLTGLAAPGRPIGNFLFLGPTGSGKTRTVEATAEVLIQNPRAVVRIDCAEFQHSHEIAKLIGSPPGYLGHRETHPLLSQEVINQHHSESVKISFILFDEIEKASDALWNLLLGILDKATLTLGDNRKVDFSQAMIFMTSNIGAGEMASLISPKLGFQAPLAEAASEVDDKLKVKLSKSGVEAARRKFTPEFMNRIDKVVVFKPLGQSELRQILNLELAEVQRRVFQAQMDKPFIFQTTEEGRQFLIGRGTDLKYGARHLKRAIELLLVQPLSNLLATDQINAGDLIQVDFDADSEKLVFHKEQEGLALQAMASMIEFPPARPARTAVAGAMFEPTKTQTAKSSKK